VVRGKSRFSTQTRKNPEMTVPISWNARLMLFKATLIVNKEDQPACFYVGEF